MQWVWLVVAVLGFALAFSAKTAGLLGIGLAAGFGGLICAFWAMAAARISESSRSDAALLTDADINALRTSVQKNRAARMTPPAPVKVELLRKQ